MNRVINITLNGQIFHLEEPAYEQLRSYIEKLKNHFRNTEGNDEIMSDIEARIAEMLQTAKANKEVIDEADVAGVIASMGLPEDFAETADAGQSAGKESAQSASNFNFTGRRRLYRDVDNRILGGVCSGIAAYFDVDPVWVRLLLVVAFFTFGTGFLLYIVLWIIMPAAETNAEKLEMRGYDVNISNLEKSFKGEMNDVKKKWDELGNKARDEYRNHYSRSVNNFFDSSRRAVHGVGYVFGKVIGFFVVIICLGLLAGVVTTALASFGIVDSNLPFNVNTLVGSRTNGLITVIGASLVFGIPLIALLIAGFRLLFEFPRLNRRVGPAFFILWFGGLVLAIAGGASIGRLYASEYSYDKEDSLNIQGDTLKLSARLLRKNDNGMYYRYYHHHGAVHVDGFNFSDMKVSLSVHPSPDNQYHLVENRESRGESVSQAASFAENIDYNYTVQGSQMIFDNIFHINQKDFYRGQDLDLILSVPIGKVIEFTPDILSIWNDIPNEQDMYDGDMPYHKWLMTEKGLKCADCPADYRKQDRERRHERRHREDDEDDDDAAIPNPAVKTLNVILI
jgi:phage shock protein PspC (stress-responsive transcriptional regulator)